MTTGLEPPPYLPPRTCPVCTHRLNITQLGCPQCGTGLSGTFRACEFCGLDEAARDVLRVFLASRGNMKDLERHLGVSYPTARARFDDVLRALGLTSTGNERSGQLSADAWARATDHPERSQPAAAPDSTAPSRGQTPDPRLETLRAVARGDLDVAEASRLLGTPVDRTDS